MNNPKFEAIYAILRLAGATSGAASEATEKILALYTAPAASLRDAEDVRLLDDIARWRKCTGLPQRIAEFGTLAAFDAFCTDLWKRFDSQRLGREKGEQS